VEESADTKVMTIYLPVSSSMVRIYIWCF